MPTVGPRCRSDDSSPAPTAAMAGMSSNVCATASIGLMPLVLPRLWHRLAATEQMLTLYHCYNFSSAIYFADDDDDQQESG